MFEPTASERIDIDTLASRPATLNGKVLGLLNNTKDQSDIILDQLEHQLKDQFDDAEVKYYRKPSVSGMPVSMKEQLTKEVDALITATGDWGSCTSWSVHDCISLERTGIPTVAIVTHVFADYGRRITRLQKMPDLPIVVINHPVAAQPESKIRSDVTGHYSQIVSALTRN